MRRVRSSGSATESIVGVTRVFNVTAGSRTDFHLSCYRMHADTQAFISDITMTAVFLPDTAD